MHAYATQRTTVREESRVQGVARGGIVEVAHGGRGRGSDGG